MVKEPWEDLGEDPSDRRGITFDFHLTVVRTQVWRTSVISAGSPNLAVLGLGSDQSP